MNMDNNKLKLTDVFKNIIFTVKLVFDLNRCFVFIQLFAFILQVLTPLVNMYFIKEIIDAISNREEINQIFLLVVGMAVVSLAVALVNRILSSCISEQSEKTAHKMKYYLGTVVSKMKYSDIEQPKIKAFISLAESNSFTEIITDAANIILTFINLGVYSAIVLVVQPWIVLLLIISIVLQCIFNKLTLNIDYNWEVISSHELNELDSIWYMLCDVKYGKELRVNLLKSWLMGKYKQARKKFYSVGYTWLKKTIVVESFSKIIKLIENISVYLILAYKVVFSSMTLGDYSFYLGSTFNLTGALSSFISAIAHMIGNGMFARDFRYLVNLAKDAEEESTFDGLSGVERIEIEFRNVSFKYPNTEKYVLKDVSFKIHSGEKISLIGENGAGKTTIVKLICKFYEPTDGEIFINDISTKELSQRAIAEKLSIVFQDFKLFSFSIAENVAMKMNINEKKVCECLEYSGVAEKVKTLPKGINTLLSKEFDSEGIELSGGEGQKVAIARAFYKNAPFIILDEPTAALDPIAEYDIYKSFAELTSGRTAIYISHRLTTTRFTDKIIVLSNGGICECGTHAQLIQVENGIYRNMFETQSQYYS